MKDMDAGSSQHGTADALEAQPILDSAAARSSDSGAVDGLEPNTLHSRWRTFAADPLVRQAAVNLALILTWYTFSTLLSLFNKIVVGKDHGIMGMGAFPAPFLMSSVQFFCQYLIAHLVLTTGWVRRKSDGSQSWKDYFRKVVPNGVATGLDIGFSNYSLVYITLSFYVMCKSTTPLFLLVFAIAWGIEKPSWSLAAVVSVITAGLLLLVYGETQFHLVGFLLVMTAAMLAGLRWTITQVLLQGTEGGGATHGARKHGGPVEVLYQLTPVMSLTLMLLSLGHEQLWTRLPASPYFATVWMGLLSFTLIFAGAIIAFAMVVAEFALIANTSALTFMVAGTFKEIVTVAAAVLFLGEKFTWINGMGLLVLIAGVVLFNYLKFRKLKGELSSGALAPCCKAGASPSSGSADGGGGEFAAAPGPGPNGELELSRAGSDDELALRGPSGGAGLGGLGLGSSSLGYSPRRAGSGEHPVLLLGTRQAFLHEGEQLLQEAAVQPRSPSRTRRLLAKVRSRNSSPTAMVAAGMDGRA